LRPRSAAAFRFGFFDGRGRRRHGGILDRHVRHQRDAVPLLEYRALAVDRPRDFKTINNCLTAWLATSCDLWKSYAGS